MHFLGLNEAGSFINVRLNPNMGPHEAIEKIARAFKDVGVVMGVKERI